MTMRLQFLFLVFIQRHNQDNLSNLSTPVFTAYREEETYGPDPSMMRENCLVQTTEWSACSKTCGLGISTRVTNDNRDCRLEKQTRLCMVRPCESQMEQSIRVSFLFYCTAYRTLQIQNQHERIAKECLMKGSLHLLPTEREKVHPYSQSLQAHEV